MKKRILILLIILLVFVIYIYPFRITNLFNVVELFPPTEHALEKKYYANELELLYICESLYDNQYMDIRIDLFDSTEQMTFYKDNKGGFKKEIIGIWDSDLINNLETIKNNGFIRILKEYNYILFQAWGSFGESAGLIFSPNEEPDMSRINAKDKVIKEIKPTGWYYYRESFE